MTAKPKGFLVPGGGTGALRLWPGLAVPAVIATLALALAPVAAAAAVPADPASARAARPVVAAGQLGGPFSAASVRAAEVVLAASGVATVADERSRVALVAVTGPVRERFTAAQVKAMALSAADGGGVAGSALDAAVPAAPGLAPFSYVLAAWAADEPTAGAAAVRRVMGAADWHHAPSLIFPSIALPLFVADVVAHSRAAPAGAAPAAGAAGAMGFFDAPCSAVSNFVQGTLSSVFAALTLKPASGAVANFFVSLWNGVVALAGQVVQGLVAKVSQFIVSKIELAAGAVAVVANIVAYLDPWSVQVSGIPNPVAAGGIGAFRAQASASGGLSAYPPALLDCLPKGVNLPPLAPDGAGATWELSGPVRATSPTTVKLSSLGRSTLDFATGAAPATGCSTAPEPQAAAATLYVARPGLSQLKQVVTDMVANGFGVAGSIVGPVLQGLLEPVLDDALAALDRLTEVNGTGFVTVTYPTSGRCSSTTVPSPTTTNAGCSYKPPPPPCPYISVSQIEQIYTKCIDLYTYSRTTTATGIPPSCSFGFPPDYRGVTITFLPPSPPEATTVDPYGCRPTSVAGIRGAFDVAPARGGWAVTVQAYVGGCGEAEQVAAIAAGHGPG